MTTFRNRHLSYSRLARFEQCPASFKLHYIDKHRAAPGVPLRFGKAIHTVLERLVKEHIQLERESLLSEERAAELWREVWAKSSLSGVEVFEEGLDILRDFVKRQGVLAHLDVLAVEQRFVLKVGPYRVLGFIDRVNHIDRSTVEIVDYKTNRMMFSHEEVDSSLQLSIYHLAARQLWPWAKRVRLTFDMLRHGVRVSTERTESQLEAAKQYIEATGRMTEEAEEFPARLNANCVWCDHREHCDAYTNALKGEREIICEDLDDLERVSQEREEVTCLAKILNARKRELEETLKIHLKERDELVLGGVRYQMVKAAAKTYPLGMTLKVLEEHLGVSARYLLHEIAVVDGKALNRLVKDSAKSLGRQKTLTLRAELEAIAERRLSRRFMAKEIHA